MKKTLLMIMALVAASIFAVSASAGDDGTCVITRLSSSASQTAKPRTEACNNVEVYIDPTIVSIKATTERPVNFRVVNLSSGQTEELPSIYISIFQLPSKFAPEYMVIEADGDVTLYGLEVPSL